MGEKERKQCDYNYMFFILLSAAEQSGKRIKPETEKQVMEKIHVKLRKTRGNRTQTRGRGGGKL